MHKLILPHRKESEETTSKLDKLVKKMEPGSCLDLVCGGGEHSCVGRSCVRIQSFQKEELATWFGDITEKEKSEVQIVSECYASTTVNIATALGFFSRMCSLQSLEMLKSKHNSVTALIVESWSGVLQMVQKQIRGWKIGLEAEMGFPVSEASSLPMNAKSLVGSKWPNSVGSLVGFLVESKWPICVEATTHYTSSVLASSQRVLIDKAFSIPKSVRLARKSHNSHRLLKKILGAVPGDQRENLSEIWGEVLLSLESENTSDLERQSTIGKAMNSAPAMEENDVTHEKMMEFEPPLEASGERSVRSINLTHSECPCHCLAQAVWYPVHSNLCLIWEVEEIGSVGLPDLQQKVTFFVLSSMLALRWIEENVSKYRESTAPTAESIHSL